jgi:8-oxo-dGTP diphosphatase
MTASSPYAGHTRVRACALIIRDGRILLVQQNVPTRPHPVWLPPGGGVEPGESTESAVIREVREETGLEIQPFALRYVYEFTEPPYHAVEFYYRAGVTGGVLKTGHDPEHPDHPLIHQASWIDLNKLGRIRLVPPFIEADIREGRISLDTISHIRPEN